MTDKKHTPEPELKYSGNFNLYFDSKHQIMFGVASHGGDKDIYIKKIVDRYNALAGIDNPAEWVEKMKKLELELTLRSDFKIQDLHILINERDNIKREYVALIQNYEELQAENERLKKEIAEWELFSKATNESIEERNQIISRLREQLSRMGGLSSSERGFCRICGGDSCDSDSHK